MRLINHLLTYLLTYAFLAVHGSMTWTKLYESATGLRKKIGPVSISEQVLNVLSTFRGQV